MKMPTYFFIGLIFIFVSFHVLYAKQEKIMNQKLLFQEMLFNIPTDKFFVLEFDPVKAKSRLFSSLKYEEALNSYGIEAPLYNLADENQEAERKEFMLQGALNEPYILTYERRKNKDSMVDYRYVILDKQTNKIVKEFRNKSISAANGNTISFVGGVDKLQEMDLVTGNIQTYCDRVDSFIKLSNNEFLVFRHDSSLIYYSNGKEKFIRHLKGIVTESGRINEKWGWFCLRPNEKYKGRLFFINLSNFKIIKSGIGIHCQLIMTLPPSDK